MSIGREMHNAHLYACKPSAATNELKIMQSAGFTMTRRDSPDLRRENDSVSVREYVEDDDEHDESSRYAPEKLSTVLRDHDFDRISLCSGLLAAMRYTLRNEAIPASMRLSTIIVSFISPKR